MRNEFSWVLVASATLACAACGGDDENGGSPSGGSGGVAGTGGAGAQGGAAGVGGATGGTGGGGTGGGSAGEGGAGATGGSGGTSGSAGSAGSAGVGACPAVDVPDGTLTETDLYMARYGLGDIESASAIMGLSDGVVLAGSSGGNSIPDDLLVMRLDDSGAVQWTSSMGGTGRDEAVALTSLGGQVGVLGNTQSITTFGSGWVVTLDPSTGALGDQYAVTAGDGLSLSSGVAEGGRLLLAGTVQGDSMDFWLASISGANEPQWGRHVGTDEPDSVNAAAIVCDQMILVGQTGGFGATGIDFWVVAFGLDGELIWQKSIGGDDLDRATTVASDPDGNLLVAGNTRSFGQGGHDAMVVKLSPEGELIWSKTVGGTGSEVPSKLVPVSDGILMVGRTDTDTANSSAWVAKLDDDGALLWSRSAGANTDYHSVADAYLGFGGLHVVGFAEDDDNDADSDWLVLKVSDAGELSGCPWVQEAPMTVADLSATLTDTTAQVTEELPGVTVTNAVASSPAVSPKVLCGP